MNIFNGTIPKYYKINTENIVIKENKEPLVCLSNFNNPRIIFEPKYYDSDIPGAIKECYMRKSVYDKLCEAIGSLPDGYKFKIFDAWRPFEVQNFLYNKQVNKLINEEKYNKEEVMELAKKFVSFPSKDPFKPFVHSTGGAIDLTIINENNEELNMGTEFDDFTDMAATYFFENSSDDEIRKNRRLLFGILTKVGFTNLPSEWWHYDYGDSFWAAINHRTESYYSGIYNIPSNSITSTT